MHSTPFYILAVLKEKCFLLCEIKRNYRGFASCGSCCGQQRSGCSDAFLAVVLYSWTLYRWTHATSHPLSSPCRSLSFTVASRKPHLASAVLKAIKTTVYDRPTVFEAATRVQLCRFRASPRRGDGLQELA